MSSELVLEYCDTDQVKPYALNSRRNEETVRVVADSIRAYGFQQPIVIDKNNVIVAGHARWKAAQVLGLSQVPVVRFQGTEQQAKEYRILDNRSQEDSAWETDLLKQELKGLDDCPTGFTEEEIKKILNDMAVSDARKVEPTTFELIVDCASEEEQKQLYDYVREELKKECRILTI